MAPAYPYSPEQETRSNILMQELQALDKRQEQVKKELRAIIYSIEKPR